MRVVRAVAKTRVDANVATGVMEPELPGYTRWSGMKPVNQVLEALLGAAEALRKAIEPRIEASRRELAMT